MKLSKIGREYAALRSAVESLRQETATGVVWMTLLSGMKVPKHDKAIAKAIAATLADLVTQLNQILTPPDRAAR